MDISVELGLLLQLTLPHGPLGGGGRGFECLKQ